MTPDQYKPVLPMLPHQKARFATHCDAIEDAIFWINQINLTNIKVSFHLCHELRQGHADQIDEILQDYFHMIRYATISGGDEVTDPNEPNWNDAIKPLGMGTFDLEIVLNKLIQLFFLYYNLPVWFLPTQPSPLFPNPILHFSNKPY